jgi:short-subunit dehydrogenase
MQPVSLITGASSGIGAALARVFARHGHKVVLVARRADKLAQLADAISAAGHPRPEVIAADLERPDAGDTIAKDLAARSLEPQFVVNNAGFGVLGSAAALDRKQQLASIDLNTRALTDLSLRWLDALKRHRGGILNVASIASFAPGPGMAVYHATKAYVLSFTEAMHQELAGTGVRVCALCPGPVHTEFFDHAGIEDDGYMPAFLARSVNRVAEDGYGGLMAGHRVVVPGSYNRIATLLPRFFPRAAVLAFMSGRWRHSRAYRP